MGRAGTMTHDYKRNGTTDLLPRDARSYTPRTADFRTRDEVLEDYVLIKDDVPSVRAAAVRMHRRIREIAPLAVTSFVCASAAARPPAREPAR